MKTLARREAFPALLRLRDEGVVAAVGCGMNQVPMLERFVADVDLDCVLLAGRYSLLDRSGGGLLATCAERGVGVILGGVFNSGVLADPDGHAVLRLRAGRGRRPSTAPATYGLAARRTASRYLRPHCSSSRRHPAVTTVVVGARSAAEVELDAGFASAVIPEALWSELDAA